VTARQHPGIGARAGDLAARLTQELDRRLADVDAELATRYPGDSGTRQPVHTVYVPADQADPGVCAAWGRQALTLLDEHAPDAGAAAAATGLGDIVDDATYAAARAKLSAQPVEDLRLDLEDGYGDRSDDEEDEAVAVAATTVSSLAGSDGGPFRLGVRVKSLEAATRRRAVRSLTLLVDRLLEFTAGRLPAGLVTTLPKVTSVEQVDAMVRACGRLEQEYGLPVGALRFEVQVETPQAILGADGAVTAARLVHAAQGRCAGLHYGTYDYSAALGIAAPYQSLEHPAADHAKAILQVATAGTGIPVSDGSTNVLPVGSRQAVTSAWRLHARLVQRSLRRGFYQGWDMHPGHLPTRYLATYAFFRADLPTSAARLRDYLQATRSGVMDEPATAQALAGAVLRSVDCGAVTSVEARELTGAEPAVLQALARRPPAAG
jgi:citrate lyase beta subunit